MALENLTATVKRGPENPTWGTPHNGWRVTLKNGRGNSYTVGYYMGIGLGHREPTAAEVLESLVSDAEGYRNASSLDDWAAEYGYELEAHKDFLAARKTYNACKRTSERLETFLTEEEYDAILNSDS
jgi:hypothetical protein